MTVIATVIDFVIVFEFGIVMVAVAFIHVPWVCSYACMHVCIYVQLCVLMVYSIKQLQRISRILLNNSSL